MPQTTEHHRAERGIAHAYPFAGVLLARLELDRSPSTYDPPDTMFLFRSGSAWTTVTLRRTEKWPDDADQPVGSARVIVEEYSTTDDLARVIEDSYGFTGWIAVLDAASQIDAELFRLWVPVQVERVLDRSSFYRPGLVGLVEAGDDAVLDELRAEVELELSAAGFNVRAVAQAAGPQRGETPVIAHVVLRRYGYEFTTVVRMDCAGEVYTRLDYETGPRFRQVGGDDDA